MNNSEIVDAALKWLRQNCPRPARRWPNHIEQSMFGMDWGKLTVHRQDVALKFPVYATTPQQREWLQKQGFKNASQCEGVIIYHHQPDEKVPAWLEKAQAKSLRSGNVDWEGSTRYGGHWE